MTSKIHTVFTGIFYFIRIIWNIMTWANAVLKYYFHVCHIFNKKPPVMAEGLTVTVLKSLSMTKAVYLVY